MLFLAVGLGLVGLGGWAGAVPGGVQPSLSCPGSAQSGQAVTLDASGTGTQAVNGDGSAATIIDYAFDFGDGSSVAGGTNQRTHAYAAGNYTASVTATDSAGTVDSATCGIAVTDPQPPANRNPTASFGVLPSAPLGGQTLYFNGIGSSDPDGDTLTYEWDFNADSSIDARGRTASWPNAPVGDLPVILTVFDGRGGSGNQRQVIHVVPRPNRAPTARFGFLPTAPVAGNTMFFNGTGSTDPDGDALGFAWDYDANGTIDAGGATPSWPGITAGNHWVTLGVSDGRGGFGSVDHIVSVALPPNVLPVADFVISPNPADVGKPVAFSAATSKDPDGDGIVRYDWTFGDGKTGTGITPALQHTYAKAGTYKVKLTVTDRRGGNASQTLSVTISPIPLPPNLAPTAAFDMSPTAAVAGQDVTFTSRSSDSDGVVKREDWDLDGDGLYDGSGPTATRAFPGAGTYSVGLRVQDDRGDISAVTHEVVVAGPEAGGGAAPGPGVTIAAVPLRKITPFPRVRMRGRYTARGARIQLLTVYAPDGTVVVAYCKGGGCPRARASTVRAVARRGSVRLRSFERELRAGARVIVYVMRKGQIGKYTRFTIRGGKPPSRRDSCVNGRKAVKCPTF